MPLSHSAVRATAAAPAIASQRGPDVAVLEGIFGDGVAVAAWQRPAPAALDAWLAHALPRAEVLELAQVRPDEPELADVLRALPDAPERAALARHLAELVELYAILTDASRVGLRFCVTAGQPCPRFHVDRVGLRLITTLRGPGTQWLEPDDVDRRRLGPGSGGLPDESSGLLRPGAAIRQLAAFDVGVFKGESWPGNAGRGAVHRSPPPDGSFRAMVTLDAL
ncbi:MAG: DUF1826 domain-containing protein [Pseudomonadota bacterium]